MKFFRVPWIVRKIFFKRTWDFNLSKNEVFLTFDDGPHPEITPWILDFLKTEQITACFFCVGENVEKYPEIYARIILDGHTVGNHTMNQNNAIKTAKKDYTNSIYNASNFIDSTIFRPPYGRLPIWLSNKILKNYKIIMWTWLSYDYDNRVSIDKILSKAHQQIKKGDILVLHDNAKIKDRQKILLPKLVDCIHLKGLKFGSMSKYMN